MSLREKLARLEKTIPFSRPERVKQIEPDHSRLLPGGLWENSLGRCWRNRVEFSLDHSHGSFRIRELFENNPDHLQLVTTNRDVKGLSLDQLLFIDTETTGLSGGVGTIAFLVGLGYFEAGRFVHTNHFVRFTAFLWA